MAPVLQQFGILLLYDIVFLAIVAAALIPLSSKCRAAFAVLKRNFFGYFINPTGYAFLCVFVLLTSSAAFSFDEFFNSNLANLDQLNKHVTLIMLVFIPAITMSIWAEERRQGTDELLLTLPAGDFDIVIGKYLASAAIFTVSLLFSQLSHFAVLVALTQGDLDTGLLCSTYLGYWFIGLVMLSFGMVASFLTSNLTVGFILGGLFNAPLVIAAYADVLFSANTARGIRQWSLSEQFDSYGRGMISFSSTIYFVMLTVLGVYLSMILIGRRHWSGGRDGNSLLGHFMLRAVSMVVIAMGLNVLFNNHDFRLDATKNQVNKLSADTRKIIAELPNKHTVYIDAFIGAEIPDDYVKTRVELLSMLKEFQSQSGGKVQVRIQQGVEPTSDTAVQAERRFGIRPQTVRTQSRGVFKDVPVILGAAVTCGLEKVVVPFFDYGIPVEYELVRSISTAATGQRKKVGIVRSDAQLMGGFSFAGGQPQNIPKAAIIEELEKQYDLEEVDPSQKIEPGKHDVLVVVQPSSLGPAELDNLVDVVKRGQPTAIFEDPLPVIDEMRFVPGTGQPKRQNPMASMFGGGGPPPPKGDITKLWKALGIECEGEPGQPSFGGPPAGFDAHIVWQRFNPYPKVQVAGFTNEFVFIRNEQPGADQPFNVKDQVSSGIEELLFPMPGAIRPIKDSNVEFTPLVQTGTASGTITFQKWQQAQESPAALQLAEGASRKAHYSLAARLKGVDDKKSDDKKGGDDKSSDWQDKPVNAIYVADIDLMASAFVRIRAQPDQVFKWRFENVTFALNVIDSLSGDDDYVGIRKRKTKYSTLRVIEAQAEVARAKESVERQKFEEEHTKALDTAEKEKKDAIQKFEDAKKAIDERRAKGEAVDPKEEEAKILQFVVWTNLANQRFENKKDQLKRERDERLKETGRKLEQQIDQIQDEFKAWAVSLPLIPPLLVGLAVWVVRRTREREGISKARLKV
ncbi:MAG TPA: Gldg family protein [Pirellulaceae bacterium]|nr:Gldg family protein [Pirellulaceae bacterium]